MYGGGLICSDEDYIVPLGWPVHFYMSRWVKWSKTLEGSKF